MTRRLALNLAKVALTLSAIAILIYKVDLGEVVTAFKQMHLVWVFAAILALALEYLVASHKTQWMAGAGSLVDHMRFNAVKSLVNQVLPSGVGGEAARMLYLAELTGSKARATAMLVADRWSGLCTQAFWSGLSLVVLASQIKQVSEWSGYWNWVGWAAMGFGIGGWFLGPRCMVWCVELFPKFIPTLFPRLVPRFKAWMLFKEMSIDAQGFSEVLLRWSQFDARNFRLFLISTANQVTMVAMLVGASMALGHVLNPWLASPIFLLSSLSTLIPSALGNLGVQEAFFAYGYHLAGESAGHGLGVALLLRVISWLPSFLGAYWLLRGRSKQDF